MDRGLQNYIESVTSEVAALVYSDGDGVSFEDKFTEFGIEILETIGKSEGARVLSYIHPDSQGRIDWKINGYSLKDEFKDDNKIYFETLDLFITYFNHESYVYNIQKDEFDKSINQVKKFLNAALKGHIDYLDQSQTELIELIKIIRKQHDNFDRVNLYFLINGSSKYSVEKTTIKGFDNLNVFIHVWDIPRFYKLSASNSNHEPIEIEFKEFLNGSPGIQCLNVPNLNDLYECYLAIIPGNVLADLYKEYSNELLESNVRAFLGQAGKYNTGIRNTIRSKPQMFLPYNNGITATAKKVETVIIDNKMFLTKLNDFQIVNGGQTTASLYHTRKKYNDADLNKIYVQMKLIVIKDIEQNNLEVPNIARFANSQNKVSELDLSSNNPYFVKIESLSRKKYVVNPENRNLSTLWYFERVNGQYREALNKLATSAQQRKFKELNPTSQKFIKSDVAKYINLWELEPYFVSQGSQKNFLQFIKKINELVKKNKFPSEFFYKKLIANALLFKEVDKLFGRKNTDAIGDTNLKSFTVSYTIAYFHYKTNNRLDLWKIYDEQLIPKDLLRFMKDLLILIYDFLVRSSSNTLISEYAKRESTWKKLIETTSFNIDFSLVNNYLISSDIRDLREIEIENEGDDIDKILLLKDEILAYGIKFWDGVRLYARSNNIFNEIEFDLIDLCNKIISKKELTPKNLLIAKKILKLIIEKNIDVSTISELSSRNDIETPLDPLKAIFDRIKLLSKDECKRVIDLVEQTKSASPGEIANLKTIFSKIQKGEQNIKENNIRTADLVLKRLSTRFKLKY